MRGRSDAAPGRLERGLRRRVFQRHTVPIAEQTPPTCPSGWHTGPPDFVGVGVQRAGTSWWFRTLSEHPDVAGKNATKELHYFDPFSNRQLTADDIERYHQWFPRPEGRVAGEWTPVYIYEPWIVPMLVQAATGARFLLLLRDPVDRFRSGVKLGLKRGFSHTDATMDAFNRGLYSGQVARLLSRVERSDLLVLLYEQLCAEPREQRRRTAEFLGLDPGRFPGDITARKRRLDKAEAVNFADGLISEVGARYRDDLTSLTQLLPELDFGWWSTLEHC